MGKGKSSGKITFYVQKKYSGKGTFDDVLNEAIGGYSAKVTRKMLRAYKQSLTKTAKEWERKAKEEAMTAIKNIKGIYKAGFKETPAIKALLDDGLADRQGNIYFNVKGHKVQDLQKIWYRLKRFNESETATAKGATDFLHQMYANIGLEYPSNKEAIERAELFFDIASKVKQIMQAEGMYGEALSYQRIWEAVREELQFDNEGWLNGIDTIEVAQRAVDRLNQILNEIEEVDELEELLGNK